MLDSRDWLNTVNQLYFNLKKDSMDTGLRADYGKLGLTYTLLYIKWASQVILVVKNLSAIAGNV